MRRLLLFAALAWAPPLPAQTAVDTTGTGTLVSEAIERSEVMENLGYLSDVIGPRLSGSPAMPRVLSQLGLPTQTSPSSPTR